MYKKILIGILIIYLVQVISFADNLTGKYSSIIDKSKRFYPSYIILESNGKYEASINNCSGFKKIKGEWILNKDKNDMKVILIIKNEQFLDEGVSEMKVIYRYFNNKLTLIKRVPDIAVGCDFFDDDVLVK